MDVTKCLVKKEEGKPTPKEMHTKSIYDIDERIVVLMREIRDPNNTEEQVAEKTRQISALAEARQVLTKNDTEVRKSRISVAGTIGTAAGIVVVEHALGPIISWARNLIKSR